ncbi:hypothetical protein GGI12_004710, partial [Dipsacomyces acuminosporus]
MQADEANLRPQRGIFNAQEYAEAKFRDGEQLSDIRKELGGQLKDVREELHSLINLRYEDFLGLSTSLVGIDSTIQAVKAPLSSLSGDISSVGDSFSSKLEYLDKRLAYRSVIREHKQMLRLFIDLSRLLDRAGGILQEARVLKERGESLEYIKCLDRAAVDLGQIRYFVGKGGDYPFVQQSAARMDEIEKDLRQALYLFLVHCIDKHHVLCERSEGGDSDKPEDVSNSENMALIAQCLRAYSTIDECAEAESIIRNRLVRPFVYKTFAEQPGKGMGIDPHVFSSMLQQTLEFVLRIGIPLVAGIEAQLLASSYNLESRVFWKEIADTIIGSLPLVFVPGMPDRFHKNYLAACRFTREFSSMFAVGSRGLQRGASSLAKEESFIEFNRKWQLSAYFSIRKTQITDAIEGRESPSVNGADKGKLLSPQPQPNRSATPVSASNRASSTIPDDASSASSRSAPAGFAVDQDTVDSLLEELCLCTRNAALAMWGIRRCWDSDVYIEPLAYRFWQLTVQIAMWFRSNADAAIRQAILDSSATTATNGSEPADYRSTNALVENVHDIYVSKRHVLNQVDDIYHLLPVRQLTTSADPENSQSPVSPLDIGAGVNGSSRALEYSAKSEIQECLRSSILHVFDTLEATAKGALEYVSSAIVSTSCANLTSHLRRTTSQFRHTNRAPPKAASAYINKLFGELASIEGTIKSLQGKSQLVDKEFGKMA